jgi:hypothetical protein
VNVTIVKDYRGQEEIHATGCADLKRRNRPYRLAEAMTMEGVTKLEEIYASYWTCIDDEAVANDPETYPTLEHVWYAWTGEFAVKPCAAALEPMAAPLGAPYVDPTQPHEFEKSTARGRCNICYSPRNAAIHQAPADTGQAAAAPLSKEQKRDLGALVLAHVAKLLPDADALALAGYPADAAADQIAAWMAYVPASTRPAALPAR